MKENPLNLSISLRGGEGNNGDFFSSGERKGNSTNMKEFSHVFRKAKSVNGGTPWERRKEKTIFLSTDSLSLKFFRLRFAFLCSGV